MNLIEEIAKRQSTIIAVTGECGDCKTWVALSFALALAEKMDIPFSVADNFVFSSRTIELTDIEIKIRRFVDLSLKEHRELNYWLRVYWDDRQNEECSVVCKFAGEEGMEDRPKVVLKYPSQAIRQEYEKIILEFMYAGKQETTNRLSRILGKE